MMKNTSPTSRSAWSIRRGTRGGNPQIVNFRPVLLKRGDIRHGLQTPVARTV